MAVLVRVYVNQHANAPEDGFATRLTFPEKPLRLSTVTMVCLSEPTGIAIDVALSVIEKSARPEFTVTFTVAELVRFPLIPVTIIV